MQKPGVARILWLRHLLLRTAPPSNTLGRSVSGARQKRWQVILVVILVFVVAVESTAYEKEQIEVPLEYFGLAPGLVITKPPPHYIKIIVYGRRASFWFNCLFFFISPLWSPLRLDLGDAGVGQGAFKIGPGDLSGRPWGMAVLSISPYPIVFDIDRLETLHVSVHVTLTGKVADGYMVSNVEVTPSTVMLRGVSKTLAARAAIKWIDTEPLDLSGLVRKTERIVSLTRPGCECWVNPSVVTVKLTLVAAGKVNKGKGFSPGDAKSEASH